MMRLAVRKFLALGRDEDGAALVTTLAMYFFMFVVLVALFAFGTNIRRRIRMQNACDAAAYSAAVVQADTFSRVAVMNRQMAWTYVQMTRRQLDYIVMNLLSRACAHYEHDRKEAKKYAEEGWSQCESRHKKQDIGWFIGANGDPSTSEKMQVNGLNFSLIPSIPGMDIITHAVNLGGAHRVDGELKLALQLAAGVSLLNMLRSGNPAVCVSGGDAFLKPALGKLSDLAKLDGDLGGGEGALLELETLNSNRETLNSVQLMDKKNKEFSADRGQGLSELKQFLRQIRAQILADRVTIAALNLAERKLVHRMPERIRKVVHETLKANLPHWLLNVCRYRVIQEEYPLAFEVTGKDDPTGALADVPGPYRGYFANLHNNHNDERRFLEWAGYDRDKKVCEILGGGWLTAGGIDQWFVRGNGIRRTEGMPGLQRCYKHWDEFDGEAKHNPYVPSCWNKEHLHESPPSVALYCEWQWWADRWFCIQLGELDFHFPLWSKGTPLVGGGSDCGFSEGPGLELLAGVRSKIDWAVHIGDIIDLVVGGSSGCTEEDDDKVISNFDTEKRDCPMEDYEDGCLLTTDLLNRKITRPLVPLTFFSRVYADDKHLYNEAYVGECAKPLILRPSYFGRNGTITVCVACKTSNACWTRTLDPTVGLYSIFNPFGEWVWAIASAKAGHSNPNSKVEDGDRRYYIHYDKDDRYGDRDGTRRPWNLVEDDWDAVMVPVRSAASLAVSSSGAASQAREDEPTAVWSQSAVSVVDKAMKNDGWLDIADESYRKQSVDWGGSVKALPGLEGDELNWKELADVMYH